MLNKTASMSHPVMAVSRYSAQICQLPFDVVKFGVAKFGECKTPKIEKTKGKSLKKQSVAGKITELHRD